MTARTWCLALLGLLLCVFAPIRALSGPPYETDDPDPTQYRGYEVYFHADYHRVDRNIQGSIGTLEINYGLLPNVQFSVDLPEAFSPIGASTLYGFGDLGVGLKYRFIQESAQSPQVAFYPSVTVATGDASQGLGEGHGTLLLPLWAQKSFGPWKIFGGGGVEFDREQSGPASSWRQGIAVTRDLNDATNVGFEIFHSAALGLQPEYTDIGVGYIGEIGEYHAIVFSGGRSLGPGASAHGYLAYEWRLGAEAGH